MTKWLLSTKLENRLTDFGEILCVPVWVWGWLMFTIGSGR